MVDLIREITEGESAVMFDTSYDIKLAKQDYFMMKQDRIIEYLSGQRARHELLKAALQVEENRFTYCIHILEAIHRELSIHLRDLEERLVEYKQSKHKNGNGQSQMLTLIESNDLLGQSIHKVTCTDSETLYLSL